MQKMLVALVLSFLVSSCEKKSSSICHDNSSTYIDLFFYAENQHKKLTVLLAKNDISETHRGHLEYILELSSKINTQTQLLADTSGGMDIVEFGYNLINSCTPYRESPASKMKICEVLREELDSIFTDDRIGNEIKANKKEYFLLPNSIVFDREYQNEVTVGQLYVDLVVMQLLVLGLEDYPGGRFM